MGSVREDHVFLFTLPTEQVGFAFCTMDLDRDSARAAIERVFHEKEQIQLQQLHYLGKLNYEHMDSGVMDQLHVFKQYDPVWLWLPSRFNKNRA